MNKLLSLVLVGAFMLSVAGCNTMKGAGQDVENTGRNIKETVQHND